MIKEPIYGSVLSLKFNDAWNRIIEFSKEYSIKKNDKINAIVVLDVSYPIRMFTYFTWVEGIVISLKSLGNNTTMINIYGKVLLSPHHLFRLITLNKKKIDKNAFLSNVKNFLKKFETVVPEYTKGGNNKKIVFLFLELFSIIIFALLLIQVLLFQLPNNSPIVTISFILFLLSQAALIVWFTRECYSRIDLSNRERNKWITYICLTGFIGCFLYYTRLGFRTDLRDFRNSGTP